MLQLAIERSLEEQHAAKKKLPADRKMMRKPPVEKTGGGSSCGGATNDGLHSSAGAQGDRGGEVSRRRHRTKPRAEREMVKVAEPCTRPKRLRRQPLTEEERCSAISVDESEEDEEVASTRSSFRVQAAAAAEARARVAARKARPIQSGHEPSVDAKAQLVVVS